jgi:hypothetical protein
VTRYERSLAARVISFLVTSPWGYERQGGVSRRRRDQPQPAMPAVMSPADISAAAHVLSRKHQRGELNDDEFAALDDALRREHSRR